MRGAGQFQRGSIGRDFNPHTLKPEFQLHVTPLDAQLVGCRPGVYVHDVSVAVRVDTSMVPSFLVAKGHGVGAGDGVVVHLVRDALRHVPIVEIVHLIVDRQDHLEMYVVAHDRSTRQGPFARRDTGSTVVGRDPFDGVGKMIRTVAS